MDLLDSAVYASIGLAIGSFIISQVTDEEDLEPRLLWMGIVVSYLLILLCYGWIELFSGDIPQSRMPVWIRSIHPLLPQTTLSLGFKLKKELRKRRSATKVFNSKN